MSSHYLATWVITKLAGREAAESTLHYVAPVGEKDSTIEHSLSVVLPYIAKREAA